MNFPKPLATIQVVIGIVCLLLPLRTWETFQHDTATTQQWAFWLLVVLLWTALAAMVVIPRLWKGYDKLRTEATELRTLNQLEQAGALECLCKAELSRVSRKQIVSVETPRYICWKNGYVALHGLARIREVARAGTLPSAQTLTPGERRDIAAAIKEVQIT